MHSCDFMTGFHRKRRGNSGINPTGQSSQNPHVEAPFVLLGKASYWSIWFARSRVLGKAARNLSMSLAVVSFPKDTRITPSASRGVAPMASSTEEGRVTPAWHAEPADTQIPARSISMRSTSGWAVGRAR